MNVIIVLLSIGAIVGFGMHFLMPYRFSRLIVDIVAGLAGAAIGALISSPFSPPSDVGQKITFLIASLVGSALAVLLARAAKI